jgi:hypothetical protein
MDLRLPYGPTSHSTLSGGSHADTTAPWPPMPPEDPSSFRWLQPGELLAIPVPTTALQLDALLRHLEIDGEFGDWRSATIHLAQARATWQRLEPALSARAEEERARPYLRAARKAAREMARSLERAAEAVRASERDEVIRLARLAIAQIEAIERVFE